MKNSMVTSKIKSSGGANKKYIVVRDGHRVSEHEYNSKNDATHEFNFWKKIVSKWPDGTKIEIKEQ
jgi:hypothetical protein